MPTVFAGRQKIRLDSPPTWHELFQEQGHQGFVSRSGILRRGASDGSLQLFAVLITGRL